MSKSIKPGMLCVITSNNEQVKSEVIGRFVTVVRRAYVGELFKSIGGITYRLNSTKTPWVVKSSHTLSWKADDGSHAYFNERPINERFLKPIEDNDGEDEMLLIAGKPPAIELKEKV